MKAMENSTVSLNGYDFEILISSDMIRSKIIEIAQKLNAELPNKPLLILGWGRMGLKV